MTKQNRSYNSDDKNKLFYGDNLDILRSNKIPPESVDLCYIDPPFNSKRNYFQIYNNQGSDDRAQAQAFTDTWEWGDEAAKGLEYILDVTNLQNGKFTEQTVELLRGLHKVLGEGALLAYIISMTLRIVEIHRVLKPTGSFYLHCDPTASHYLKLVSDTIFVADRRGGDFINEIIWWYKRWSNVARNFQRMHDVILYYSKGRDYNFNVQYQPYSKPEAIENTIRGVVNGKLVRLKDEQGNFIERTSENKGVACHDVFEIQHIQPTAKERLGYPTQKPESLLERIIKASSNEGDVVLDAYCGCGTTVAVAERLGRRWIGIDITYQSISLILKRFEDTFKEKAAEVLGNIHLDGVPRDIKSAHALANLKGDRTRKEFEKWAVLTYSRNQARINDKKGADGGIDGTAYFMVDKNQNGKAVFQVKSGGANRGDIAKLNSDRQREKAEFGILIMMDEPTKPMKQEAQGVGRYKHPILNREDDRIQIVTIEDILEGKSLDLPMARPDAVKSAEEDLSSQQIDFKNLI